MKNFVKELEWRGMIHDIMPGTEEKLMEGCMWESTLLQTLSMSGILSA